jgi:hypothetical protein
MFSGLFHTVKLFFILFFVMTIVALLGGASLYNSVTHGSGEALPTFLVGLGMVTAVVNSARKLLMWAVMSTGVSRTLLALSFIFFGDTIFHVAIFLLAVCLNFLRPKFLVVFGLTLLLAHVLDLGSALDRSLGFEDFRPGMLSQTLSHVVQQGGLLALHFLPLLLTLQLAKVTVHQALEYLPKVGGEFSMLAVMVLNRLSLLELSNVGYNVLAWNINWRLWNGHMGLRLYFCDDPRSEGMHTWATVAGCPSYSTHSDALNCLCRSDLGCANATNEVDCNSFCTFLTSPKEILYDSTGDVEMCRQTGHILFCVLVAMAVHTLLVRLQRMAILSGTTSLGLYLLNMPVSIAGLSLKPSILLVASFTQRYVSVPLTRLTGLDPTPAVMLPQGTLGAITPWGMLSAFYAFVKLFLYYLIVATVLDFFLFGWIFTLGGPFLVYYWLVKSDPRKSQSG